MIIEVDQSGKIEQTNFHTVLALSNSVSSAVIVTAVSKRKALLALRKKGLPAGEIYLGLFCAVLVCLLKCCNLKGKDLQIDTEYKGKNRKIVDFLIRYFGSNYFRSIEFVFVGKKSRAHELALDCFRVPSKANKKISYTKLVNTFWKLNKKGSGKH